MPSRNVESLLAEPAWRLRYGVSISAVGTPRDNACTAISVSISNPVDRTGKDFANRRENTL